MGKIIPYEYHEVVVFNGKKNIHLKYGDPFMGLSNSERPDWARIAHMKEDLFMQRASFLGYIPEKQRFGEAWEYDFSLFDPKYPEIRVAMQLRSPNYDATRNSMDISLTCLYNGDYKSIDPKVAPFILAALPYYVFNKDEYPHPAFYIFPSVDIMSANPSAKRMDLGLFKEATTKSMMANRDEYLERWDLIEDWIKSKAALLGRDTTSEQVGLVRVDSNLISENTLIKVDPAALEKNLVKVGSNSKKKRKNKIVLQSENLN